ncbi:MAG: type II toxin-antitoxin system VapB family antitoxin [Spirochaetaceae bacterium]|nr:MAG: type II toxin-antitoxin system VapB family antitoxin [Spirochaetaceae bacterium]
MATNLAIDDKLLNKALKISGLKTKKETVSIALKEFIQRRKQEDIVNLFGTIDYGIYDYKKLRSK